MPIREIIEQHARAVCTIDSRRTVEEAIEAMRTQHAGALVVMEDGRPVGLFSGSDVLRCYVNKRGRAFTDIEVKDAMTNKLIVTEPEEEISAALEMMIRADIRHLPVVENKTIIAMLTINAIVSHQLGTLTQELHYLHEYISDLQTARQD